MYKRICMGDGMGGFFINSGIYGPTTVAVLVFLVACQDLCYHFIDTSIFSFSFP